MKRLIITIIAGIFLLSWVRSDAFNGNKFDAALIDKAEDGSKTVVTLKDKENQVFKVVYQDETMLDKAAPKIIKFKNEFYGWREISFTEINFLVFDDFLEVFVVPKKIMYKDNNLASAVPSGITMVSQGAQDVMRYDFRIIKGNYFLRIEGDYFNEGELLAKLGYAYDYPLTFLQKSGSNISGGQSQTGVTDTTGTDEKARQALIYLLNEDWNGRPKSVPPETIKKVVELKENNPWMTKAQLWKTLKREKIKLTKKEMELILIIYLNEFEF